MPPTSTRSSRSKLDGQQIECSTVDLANYIVFAKAESFGLKGTEDPDEMDGNAELLAKLEKFRLTVGVAQGFAKDLDEARLLCSQSPFLALISKPQDWKEYSSGKPHKASESDFHAFSLLDGRIHKSYQVTGSSCVAVAAFIPGTVVQQMSGKTGLGGKIRIGHPSGIMDVQVQTRQDGGKVEVTEASLIRTARRLADGQVYVAADKLPWRPESGGKIHMHATQPPTQKGLLNQTFYAK